MLHKHIRASLLALLLPLLLQANHLLSNEILKPEAQKLINEMGDELLDKTGINTYLLATQKHFPVGFNFVEYSQEYKGKMEKPYVLFIFAPHAKITEKIEMTGRIGIIPSSKKIATLYNHDEVQDQALGVVAMKDKNSKEDKHNIGILQAYSELADQIAESKGLELTKTIPNDTHNMVNIFRVVLYFGSALLVWIFFLRPIFRRRKNGK